MGPHVRQRKRLTRGTRAALHDVPNSVTWLVIFPGLAISVVVFASNLFGNGLRDYLDPRLRI